MLNLLVEFFFNIVLSSSEYSGSVPVDTISGLLDVMDDPPIRNGIIVV